MSTEEVMLKNVSEPRQKGNMKRISTERMQTKRQQKPKSACGMRRRRISNQMKRGAIKSVSIFTPLASPRIISMHMRQNQEDERNENLRRTSLYRWWRKACCC